MDHDSLDRLRQAHPAWRILVADHAPLVLSFLTLAFIQPNRRAIPAPEIAAHLDAYLDHLRETYPERYPRSARDYLEDWAAPNRAYLRKYYPKSGPDAEFDLTPATEKAIEWLQTLAPQQFIGTESRLLTLFQLLRDLAAGAQDDPSARIRDLTRRRDDIEREIERVREGRAGPLDATQVKERYAQVADTARRLLADLTPKARHHSAPVTASRFAELHTRSSADYASPNASHLSQLKISRFAPAKLMKCADFSSWRRPCNCVNRG